MIRPDRRGILFIGIAVWLLSLGMWVLYARPTELIDSYAKCAEEGYPVSDTEPPTCGAGGRTFVGPVRSGAPIANSGTTGVVQPFEILVEGDSGGTYPNRQEVLTTNAAWEHYWREIHGHLQTPPPLLPVDFIKNDVVAVSEGQKSTGGYGLKVTTITTTSKGTVVDITESIPTVTCVVTQSFTNRYFIVKTPKLPTPVSYRITTDHRHCN